MELPQLKYIKKAQKRDAQAKYLMGMAYKNGYQTKADIKKAIDCFINAAFISEDEKLKAKAKEEYVDTLSLGAYDSEYIIEQCTELNEETDGNNGYSYLAETYIIEEQYQAALAALKTAEQKKASRCYYVIGSLHKVGELLEKNEQKAFEYFVKSAEAGDYRGIRELGVCYANGIGTQKDVNKAIEYLTTAANELDREARLYLARCILENNIEDRYGDAIVLLNGLDYKLPSRYPQAQEYLYCNALCYIDGKGVKQNVKYGMNMLTKYMYKNEDALKKLMEIAKKNNIDQTYKMYENQLKDLQKEKEKEAKQQQQEIQKSGVNIETASEEDMKNVKLNTPFFGTLHDVYVDHLQMFNKCPNCGSENLKRWDTSSGQLRRTVVWEDEITHRYINTTHPVDFSGLTQTQTYACSDCGCEFEKIRNEKLEEKEVRGFINTTTEVYSIVTVECKAKKNCDANAQKILKSLKSKTRTKR